MFKGLYCTTEAEGFRKKISGVSLKLILNNNISPSFPWLWLKEGALIISISSKKHQGIIRSGWDGNKTLLIRISNMISSFNKSALSQEGRVTTLSKFPREYDWNMRTRDVNWDDDVYADTITTDEEPSVWVNHTPVRVWYMKSRKSMFLCRVDAEKKHLWVVFGRRFRGAHLSSSLES
jgi:hypothetical protein